MMNKMKRRIAILETRRFESPRVAEMGRRVHRMSDEEYAHLTECVVDERITDLPPLFDLRTLTIEELEAYIAVVIADSVR